MDNSVEIKSGGWLAYFNLATVIFITVVSAVMFVTQGLLRANLGVSICFGAILVFTCVLTYFIAKNLIIKPVILRLGETGIEILRGNQQRFEWREIQAVAGYSVVGSEAGAEGLAIQLKDPSYMSESNRKKIRKKILSCKLDSSQTEKFYSDILVDLLMCTVPAKEVVESIIPKLQPISADREDISHQELFDQSKAKRITLMLGGFLGGMAIGAAIYWLIKV